MNKVLILISILFTSVLIVSNIAGWVPNGAYIITWNGDTSTLVIISVITWIIAWYWLKWYLSEKPNNNYDDDENWFNF